MDKPDMVNRPSHYNKGGIECIDAIREALGEEGFKAYCRGNAIKYTWRAGLKLNEQEDLMKASWYNRMAAGDDPRKDTKSTFGNAPPYRAVPDFDYNYGTGDSTYEYKTIIVDSSPPKTGSCTYTPPTTDSPSPTTPSTPPTTSTNIVTSSPNTISIDSNDNLVYVTNTKKKCRV